MRICLVWSRQESAEALASTADRTSWASAHRKSLQDHNGKSQLVHKAREMLVLFLNDQTDPHGSQIWVDVSRCFSEVTPEEQCVLCPVRGSEKHWLVQRLQPDQLCQREHVPMSSAVTALEHCLV